ncbi:O-antigen ligase family protein [Pseudomonas corrugata]|uniref:O-antigen ligase family protein n=1 Tax=Pseudomonas corrugata TaxID=47879 RepID=UPI0004BC8D73|nr:O-antigen ligase family protein [Pseudomonas corrugata]
MFSYMDDESVAAKWQVVILWALSIGLFILISGKVWMVSGSARNTQIYLWLLLPSLIFLIVNVFTRRGGQLQVQYLPWIAFLIWGALSSAWATGSETSSFSFVKRGLFIVLFLFAIYLLMSKREVFLRRALLCSVLFVFFGALATLIYQFGWLDRPMTYRAFRIDRLGIGEIANYRYPVAAGIFHGAIATWVFGIAIDHRTGLRTALFWLFVFATLALYILLTYARGAWIGLGIGCFLVVVLQNSRRGWWVLGLCFVAVVVGAIIWKDHLLNEIFKRQLSGREPIWQYYFSVMQDHWTFGFGLGTPFTYNWPDGKTSSPHAHSLYLQQVYDSGVISVFMLGVGLLGLCYKAWNYRNNFWVRLAFPALIYALIVMLTDVERIFTRPSDYWTVFWLPVAILLAVPTKPKVLALDIPSEETGIVSTR